MIRLVKVKNKYLMRMGKIGPRIFPWPHKKSNLFSIMNTIITNRTEAK